MVNERPCTSWPAVCAVASVSTRWSCQRQAPVAWQSRRTSPASAPPPPGSASGPRSATRPAPARPSAAPPHSGRRRKASSAPAVGQGNRIVEGAGPSHQVVRISRNSKVVRSASASSKGRSCRHCSGHGKSLARRNSTSCHRTRNNLGPDRCTKGAGCGAPCAKPKLSVRKLEGRCSVADDSPGGSRSRASVALVVYESAQPALRSAAAMTTAIDRHTRRDIGTP